MAARLHALDSLRGLAALAVLFGHCLDVFPEFGTRPYHGPQSWMGLLFRQSPLEVFRDGKSAVLVFFVLSGLVLSLPFLQGRAPRYGVYAARRVARLYPPYIAALLTAAALQAWLAADLPRGGSTWVAEYNWTEALNARTGLDYAAMLGSRVTLDNPVWSLDYEMRMSLVLPFLLLPMRRFGIAGGIATGAVLLAASAPLAHQLTPGLAHALGWTCLYGATFMLGAVLAGQVDRLCAIRSKTVPVVLALLAWAIFYLNWRDTMLGMGAAALIAAVLVPGPIAGFCATGPARFLGRISFSLYLIHVPVLLTMLTLLRGVLDTRLVVALCVPVAMGVACLFHHAVEAPAHRLARAIGR